MLSFFRQYRLRKHLRTAVLTGRIAPLTSFLAKEYRLDPATVLSTTQTVIKAQLFAIRNAVRGLESRYTFRSLKKDSARVLRHLKNLEQNVTELGLRAELRKQVQDIRATLQRK